MKKIGIVAITPNGYILGEKIAEEYSGIDLLTIRERENWKASWNTLDELVRDNFSKYDGLIFIMAVGIVVRMIAKEIVSKDHDPAVVVIDELAKHTISLISGHLGGGNKLTKEISVFLENDPVITTATDINNKYALDSFAKDYGLKIDQVSKIKYFNKAILEGKRIPVFFEEGIIISDIYEEFSFSLLDPKEHLGKSRDLKAVITHQLKEKDENIVFLRPANLILGVGCKKNYSPELFEKNVLKELADNNIALSSIKEIRSIELKAYEKAIVDFAEKYRIPYKTFSSEEINLVYENNPDLKRSEFVYRTTGSYGVAEPVSLAGADKLELLLNRKELSGMTMAVSIEKPCYLVKKDTRWLIKRRDNI